MPAGPFQRAPQAPARPPSRAKVSNRTFLVACSFLFSCLNFLTGTPAVLSAPAASFVLSSRTVWSLGKTRCPEGATGQAGTTRFSSHVATGRTCWVHIQIATCSCSSPTQRIYGVHRRGESSVACASYQLSGDKNARALLARAFSFLRQWRRKHRVGS